MTSINTFTRPNADVEMPVYEMNIKILLKYLRNLVVIKS